MGELLTLALLESTHQFPGPYIFKVFGRPENGFVARAVAAVRDALAEPIDPPFKVRQTPAGRYVSVTVTPTVQGAEQVLAVYRRVRGVAGLVMVW
jgi:putative lipoic acid-binding regulatory protein